MVTYQARVFAGDFKALKNTSFLCCGLRGKQARWNCRYLCSCLQHKCGRWRRRTRRRRSRCLRKWIIRSGTVKRLQKFLGVAWTRSSSLKVLCSMRLEDGHRNPFRDIHLGQAVRRKAWNLFLWKSSVLLELIYYCHYRVLQKGLQLELFIVVGWYLRIQMCLCLCSPLGASKMPRRPLLGVTFDQTWVSESTLRGVLRLLFPGSSGVETNFHPFRFGDVP